MGDTFSKVSPAGETVLVLDSGTQLPVHSAYLVPRSEVLATAIALAASTSEDDKNAKLRVPLPSTPDSEAQLLLTAVYSQRPETLLQSWDKLQLLALAKVCHRFAFEELLAMIDEVCWPSNQAGLLLAGDSLHCRSLHSFQAPCACGTPSSVWLGFEQAINLQALVVKCGAQRSSSLFATDRAKTCLGVKDAVPTYWEARQLGLKGLEAECAAFVGQHAKAVAAEVPTDPLCMVLAEAIKLPLPSAQLKAELSSIKQGLSSRASSCGACNNAYQALASLLHSLE